MSKDNRIYIDHILKGIDLILDYIADKDQIVS